jgi:UDP-3-O-[3-hydroxymyristoyl] glucosamine N-acyltransferase
MKFSEIINQLGNVVTSNSNLDQNPEITGVAAIDKAINGNISYVESPKFASLIESTNAPALILPNNEDLQTKATARGIAWLATAEPRLVFAQTIRFFYKPYRPQSIIHPSAVIHDTAKIGNNAAIGAHVVIDQGVEVGDDVVIHPNVVIYPDVKIGDRTTLHANCSIHERSQIGADCVIHSGVVIGAEGFGFVATRTGWLKMEQSGYTVLEDGVEIGCNSAVDRPAVGETRIGKNTKIDNLVQIGHGCKIGSGCAISGQVGIAGGVQIGNRVILAGQVGIANQVKIGDGAIASAQAGIHSNVEPGEIVSGTPAVAHKIYLQVSAIYSRLPEMYQSLKKIKRNFKI